MLRVLAIELLVLHILTLLLGRGRNLISSFLRRPRRTGSGAVIHAEESGVGLEVIEKGLLIGLSLILQQTFLQLDLALEDSGVDQWLGLVDTLHRDRLAAVRFDDERGELNDRLLGGLLPLVGLGLLVKLVEDGVALEEVGVVVGDVGADVTGG